MAVEVRAPAKLNLALEVLGRRQDGYHEIVSVMQTIDVEDFIRVEEAPSLSLAISAREGWELPVAGPANLAYRAAEALCEASGKAGLGATIKLEKGTPTGVGLGGGSSDAAAVLRALNLLWGLNLTLEQLEALGAGLGSDVPFFLTGGTAFVSGRGERVEALPDTQEMAFTLFLAEGFVVDKTRRMYAALTPADYSDGNRTRDTATFVAQNANFDAGFYTNVFDPHIGAVAEFLALSMARCCEAGLEVHATGSGPGFFSPVRLIEVPESLQRELAEEWGVRGIECRSLARGAAVSLRQV